MSYILFINSVETARVDCPNKAAGIALDAARIHGADAVTVETHGVWGQYAAPELIGKPCVFVYDWQRAVKELMR